MLSLGHLLDLSPLRDFFGFGPSSPLGWIWTLSSLCILYVLAPDICDNYLHSKITPTLVEIIRIKPYHYVRCFTFTPFMQGLKLAFSGRQQEVNQMLKVDNYFVSGFAV